MSNVQLMGANIYDTQIVMHSETSTDDVLLSQEPQKTHLTQQTNMNLLIKANTNNKQVTNKWTERGYHVQGYTDVSHKYVKLKK